MPGHVGELELLQTSPSLLTPSFLNKDSRITSSATRLSVVMPYLENLGSHPIRQTHGFPPHPHEWFCFWDTVFLQEKEKGLPVEHTAEREHDNPAPIILAAVLRSCS
jgi:hypothetical protein